MADVSVKVQPGDTQDTFVHRCESDDGINSMIPNDPKARTDACLRIWERNKQEATKNRDEQKEGSLEAHPAKAWTVAGDQMKITSLPTLSQR